MQPQEDFGISGVKRMHEIRYKPLYLQRPTKSIYIKALMYFTTRLQVNEGKEGLKVIGT